MSGVHNEIKTDLPAFARGELGERERAVVERHLAGCDSCRRELRDIETVAGLASSALLEFHAPRDLEDRTFALVRLEAGGETATRRPATAETSWRERLRPRLLLAPGMAALVVGLTILAAVMWLRVSDLQEQLDGIEPSPGEVAQVVRLRPTVAGAPVGRADLIRVDDENLEIVLTAEGFPPTPAGYHYELWLGSGNGWTSAGSFNTLGGRDEKFDFQVGVDPIKFPILDVTLERADGDPGRDGKEIMRGRVDITELAT